MLDNLSLEEDGIVVLRRVLSPDEAAMYREKVDRVLTEYTEAQEKAGLSYLASGAIHHPFLFDPGFIDLLNLDTVIPYVDSWFKGKYTVNSFGGVVNLPGRQGYVHNVHRDTRFYCGEYRLFLNEIIVLDDFTRENGATRIMPKAYSTGDKPDDETFLSNSQMLLARAGDVVLFDSNLWHSARPNETDSRRRCVTVTYSRPWIKPQFDFSVLVSKSPECFSEREQQLLGYFSRVPGSLSDWLNPEESRFYRKDQDRTS